MTTVPAAEQLIAQLVVLLRRHAADRQQGQQEHDRKHPC